MLPSGMAWVSVVSTKTGEVARAACTDVARHSVVVLTGRPGQGRQLRRVQATLRAGGYQARYLTDGAASHLLVVTAPGQEMPRITAWWGG
jgi:hypothetical protein